MAQQFINLGDTGQQLVDRLENNFTDLYDAKHEHGNKALLDSLTQESIDGVTGGVLVCATGATTAAKVVDLPNFVLSTGVTIWVRFNTANTAASPTLNVNGTGARSIRVNTQLINSATLARRINANVVYGFRFDGTDWNMFVLGANLPTMGIGYGTCTTAAGTTNKIGTIAGFARRIGSIAVLHWSNTPTAMSTLAINDTAAANVMYAGEQITAANGNLDLLAGGGTYIFAFDGTAYQLANPAVASGGGGAENAVLYVTQTLSVLQQLRARLNISAPHREEVVQHTIQSLTVAQQEQARHNIGALGMEVLTFAQPVTIDNIPLSQLQAAINSLPKLLNCDVVINVLSGTLNGEINISHFFGGGTLTIRGATTATTTHNVVRFVLHGNRNAQIMISGFRCSSTTGDAVSTTLSSSLLHLEHMNINGGASANIGNVGVRANTAEVAIAGNCIISNKERAIIAGAHSLVTAWQLTGSGNNILYSASPGGTVSVANYSTSFLGNRFAEEETSGRVIIGVGIAFASTMANAQNAVDGIPRDVRSNFTINFSAGTFSGNLTLARRHGLGTITLNGATSITTTHNVQGVIIRECPVAHIVVRGFNCTNTTGNSVHVIDTPTVLLENMRMIGGVSSTANHNGVLAQHGSVVVIQPSQISNKATALFASSSAEIRTSGLTGATNNVVARAVSAVIRRAGTMPTGTTAFTQSDGGQVL